MSFTFKQFHINDDKCGMKVGTDSILLGSIVQVNANDRILDIGSGSGLLSLMMAQRIQGKGTVIGVEIDETAVAQSKQNVVDSPWHETVNVMQTDINQYDVDLPFDVIISNPPYFNNSLLGPAKARNTARHSQLLTQQQLLGNASRLLSDTGQFWLVLPVEQAKQLISQSETSALQLNQLCQVFTRQGKPVHRYIMSFGKFSVDEVAKSEIDVYDGDNQYSRQFIALTRNFYLTR
jgi:tRNA1Val (adenine37-N6)-methyltransferase